MNNYEKSKKRYMFLAECRYFISKLNIKYGQSVELPGEVIEELNSLLSRAEDEVGRDHLSIARGLTESIIKSGMLDLIERCNQKRPADFAAGVMAVRLTFAQIVDSIGNESDPIMGLYGILAVEWFLNNQKGATE